MIEMKYPIGRFNGVPFAGIRGEDGHNGVDGTDGVSPTIHIGTVSSGPTPSVTNSGTEQNAVFDFVLPSSVPSDPSGILYVNFTIDESIEPVVDEATGAVQYNAFADKTINEISDAMKENKYPIAVVPYIYDGIIIPPIRQYCRMVNCYQSENDVGEISYIGFTFFVIDLLAEGISADDKERIHCITISMESVQPSSTQANIVLSMAGPRAFAKMSDIENAIASIAVYDGVVRYPEENQS